MAYMRLTPQKHRHDAKVSALTKGFLTYCALPVDTPLHIARKGKFVCGIARLGVSLHVHLSNLHIVYGSAIPRVMSWHPGPQPSLEISHWGFAWVNCTQKKRSAHWVWISK